MPAAAHHRQVHAGTPALHPHRQDVRVVIRLRLHRLLVQHLGQRRNLIAHFCRLFELQRRGVRLHARLQVLQQGLRVALQKGLRVAHVLHIVLRRDQAHAGPGAALDLVQKAGPGAVAEDRVFAGAQAKHLLQQLYRLLHRPGAGIGSEKPVSLVHATAVIAHARISGGAGAARDHHAVAGARTAELEVGVALVVAKQDVVLGVQRLDQVVFQQQRLGLGTHHRGLHAHDAAHHVADARAVVRLLEIAGHALLQVPRLAHVEHAAVSVEIAVHARQRRQRGHFAQQLRRVF